jgi:hypothetical protein
MNYAKLSERIRIQNGRGIWTERDRQLLDRFRVEDQAIEFSMKPLLVENEDENRD